jgi:hypothetical protein
LWHTPQALLFTQDLSRSSPDHLIAGCAPERPLSSVSSTPMTSSRLGVSPTKPTCPVHTPWLREPCREDIAHRWPPESRHRPRQLHRSTRASCSARWPGRAQPMLVWAGRPMCTVCIGPCTGNRPSNRSELNSFFFFIFSSIQVQILEIHIYLNICPKIMKSVLLFF